jgi:hypothetical protein
VTQSLLQSKHDPHEAMQKYTLLLTTARELWQGRLLERTQTDDGQVAWRTVLNDKRVPVQATREQWEAQLLEIYRSKDGLNIPSVNPEHVSIVAEAMVGPDGRMRDIEAMGSGKDRIDGFANGSTMDRLAYGGSFETLYQAATAREKLFEGTQNGHFAPFEIRRNLRELENYELRKERAADPTRDVPEAELVHIGARDVLSPDNPLARERQARRSPVATAVRAPRFVPEPEAEVAAPDSDGFEHYM